MTGSRDSNSRAARKESKEIKEAILSAAIALETKGKFRVMKTSGRIPALEHFLHIAGGHHTYEKLLKARDVLDKLFDYDGPKLSKTHVKKLINTPVRDTQVYVKIEFFETLTNAEYEAITAGRNMRSNKSAHYEPMFGMYVNVNERDSCMGIYNEMMPFGTKININDLEHLDLLETLLKDPEFKDYWEVKMMKTYAPVVKLTTVTPPTGARDFGRTTYVRDANMKALSNPYITQRVGDDGFRAKFDGAEGSCFFNIVLGVYKFVIEKSQRGKNWLKTHKLTLDGIIAGRNGGECTIAEMVEHFFKPFNLGLRVLNIQNQLMDDCCFHPEMYGKSVNKNINPRVLTIVLHDNHVECCDIDDAMIRKIAVDFPFDQEALKFVNKRKSNACIECFGHFPSAFERDDKVAFIKDADEIKANEGELLYDGDLGHLAKVLYVEKGVSPQVWMDGLTVNKLIIGLDDEKKITIRNHAEVGERIGCTRPYIQFKNTLDKEYNSTSLKSYYDQDTLEVFKQNLLMATKLVVNSTPLAPRSHVKRSMVPVVGVDFNKFYLSSWMDIDQFPVSIEDDRWNRNWDGVIGANNQYLVRRVRSEKNNIFTFQEEGVLDGINLALPCNVEKFYIIAEFVPARVMKHDKKVVRSIVDSGESAADIKKAVVEFFGTCFKTKRENSVARIFGDESEAAYFAEQQGLNRHAFKVIETVDCVMSVTNGAVSVELKVRKLWVVKTTSMTVKLCDGYVPMYSVLRNRATQKLQALYESMLNAGVTVYKFQTDCVYVGHDEAFLAWEEKNASLFSFDNFAESIGKLKKLPVEQMKFECNIKWGRKETFNVGSWADKNVPEYGVTYNQYSVADEYDNDAINALIDGKKVSLLLAKYPGSGKSYNTVMYVKSKGLKTLYVSCDNATGRGIRKRGDYFCTLNKFFGLGLDNKRSATMSRVCDRLEKDGYGAVVFEELLKADLKKIMEVRRWVQKNASLYVIMANGDPFQLLSEQNDKGFYNNIKNFGEYKINVVKRIFPECLYLNKCKRFKKAEDVKKLEKIFKDLFVKCLSVKEVGEKYFHVMDLNWDDQLNDDDTIISYSRMAAWNLRKGEMRVGMNIRCQDHTGNSNIHINDMFILAEIGEMCTLMNIVDDSVVSVTEHALYRFFEPEGAVTCHSVQGSTIEGRIVIAEYDSIMANDPRWFWTAMTRAEELASVVLLRGVDALDRKSIMKNIERKIVGYKAQDAKAGRECDLTKDYVYGLLKSYKLRCCECHRSVIETWEVDRKDCNVGHVVGNCQLMCLSCNRAKGAVEKKSKVKVNGSN